LPIDCLKIFLSVPMQDDNKNVIVKIENIFFMSLAFKNFKFRSKF
jgi:hypothetical protein